MSVKNKTVWVTDHAVTHSDLKKPFEVTKTKNTTRVRVGSDLPQSEVDSLIRAGYDVIITPPKK